MILRKKRKPGAFYGITYMATDLILRIIKTLGPEAKLKCREQYLKNNKVKTIFGIRHFLSNGDIKENDFSIFKVNNSTFTRVRM